MATPAECIRLGELSHAGRWLWVLVFLLLALMTIAVSYYLLAESSISGQPWTLIEALFMAVLIVTTIGLKEVYSLSETGELCVHSPYVLGGRDLAAAAVEPGGVHFLEQVLHQQEFDVDFRSIAVSPDSPVIGKPRLGSGVMQEDGAMILAVLGADKALHTNPRPSTTLKRGDTLIAMGTHQQLTALERAVAK